MLLNGDVWGLGLVVRSEEFASDLPTTSGDQTPA